MLNSFFVIKIKTKIVLLFTYALHIIGKYFKMLLTRQKYTLLKKSKIWQLEKSLQHHLRRKHGIFFLTSYMYISQDVSFVTTFVTQHQHAFELMCQ